MADEIKTLSGQISALATRVGSEMKVNKTAIAANAKAVSDLATKTAQDILDAKQAVKDDLLNGAGTAYDTLKELGDLIDANKSGIEALQGLAAGHVKFDAAQELSADQKKTARDNIGALAAADLSEIEAGIAANKAATEANAAAISANETAISNNATAISTLRADMGDHTADFVAAFEAALTAVDETAGE